MRVMQMLKKVYPSTFKTVKNHDTNSNQYAAFEIYPPGGMENMVQKDIRLKSRSFEVMKESVNKLLRQTGLSPAEYQKAKKLKGFDAKNYKWDKKKDLYVKESVNEAKKFKPGDKWSDDFDYVGMLKYGIQKKMPEQYKLEDLKKLAASMEDVNYHREAGHLFDTIGHLERAGAMARANKSIKGYGDLINKSWKLFRKEVGKTLKSIKEVRLNEELRDDELNTLATNLAYTMPNHTKFDDKKGPTDSQIMKAMKKYFKDLYKYSTTPQKKQAIKIVKKVLSEGKLTEDFSQRRGNFRIYLRKEIKRAKKITVKSLKLVYTKIKKGIDKGRWEHNKSGNAVYSDEQVVKQLAGILEDDIKKSQTYNAEEVRNMVLFEGKLRRQTENH